MLDMLGRKLQWRDKVIFVRYGKDELEYGMVEKVETKKVYVEASNGNVYARNSNQVIKVQ